MLIVVTAVLVTPLTVVRLTNLAVVRIVGMIWSWGGFFEIEEPLEGPRRRFALRRRGGDMRIERVMKVESYDGKSDFPNFGEVVRQQLINSQPTKA